MELKIFLFVLLSGCVETCLGPQNIQYTKSMVHLIYAGTIIACLNYDYYYYYCYLTLDDVCKIHTVDAFGAA